MLTVRMLTRAFNFLLQCRCRSARKQATITGDREEEEKSESATDSDGEEEEEETKEADQESSSTDDEEEEEEKDSIAQTDDAPLGHCMSCSTPLLSYLICYTCKRQFTCCNSCYSKPSVHRQLTQHYRDCVKLELTPQQKQKQKSEMGQGDKYYNGRDRVQYNQPCRYCARCETSKDATICACKVAYYCTRECRTADCERHEANRECIKKVTQQMPPNFDAPSIRHSIVIPDLLAHVISFLSLYQWNQAARVNHAWRNVTLLPSAFPNEPKYAPIQAPNIGHTHRACFRSHNWHQRENDAAVLAHLRDYTHLRRFSYFIPSSNIASVIDVLPSSLTSLSILLPLMQPISSSTITRFTRLHTLSIQFEQGSTLLDNFAVTLQQLMSLCDLTLSVLEISDQDEFNELTGKEKVEHMEQSDRTALADIVSMISIHLVSLTRLSISSYQHGLSQMLTLHQFPSITDLSLNEIIRASTPDRDISALAHLSPSFPSVTKLSFTAIFSQFLLSDPINQLKKQLALDSVITCIASLGSQLQSLTLRLHSQPIEEDDDEVWDDQFKLDRIQLERLYAQCEGLESLVFTNFMDRMRSEEDVAILARLTPNIKSLGICFKDSVSVTALSTIEFAMVSFIHLETLLLDAPITRSLILSPSSSAYLEVRDSRPPLRHVSLRGFDFETQLPALLRLLPRIVTLQIHNGSLSPCRLFEYAQYRPLILTEQLREMDHPHNIRRMQTIQESQLTSWLDQDGPLNSASIRHLQSISSSHFALSYYNRGRECAAASDSLHSDSHRWMFDRVREWHWHYIEIKFVNSSSRSSKPIAIALPSAYAFYRDAAWLYSHPDDSSKNDEARVIHTQLERLAQEHHSYKPLWI